MAAICGRIFVNIVLWGALLWLTNFLAAENSKTAEAETDIGGLIPLKKPVAQPASRSIFSAPILADRLHFTLGVTMSGNFFNKETELSKLGAALGGGAAAQEFARYNAIEERIPLNNPSQQAGGCPDIPAVPLAQPIKVDAQSFPAQLFTVQGKRCEVLQAEGNTLTLIGPEFQAGLRYDLLRWLSISAAFQIAIILPASYMARFRYLGESKDIQINGLVDPVTNLPIDSIGADILVDSTARLTMSGTSIEIPIAFNFEILRTEYSQVYLGMGIAFTFASYKRTTQATQSVTVQANGQTFDLGNTDYIPVSNTESIQAMTLINTVGGRYRITDRAWFYLEFKWLRGGSVTDVQGTRVKSGESYASDTMAAVILDQIAPGAVARALRSSSEPNGARDINGLTVGYALRWLAGISYAF